MKQFKSIGISYKTANLELREKVAFDEAGVRAFIRKGQEILELEDLMVVSTCNRTEVYYSSGRSLKSEICSLIKIHHALDFSLDEYFGELEAHAAVNHLYEVALGVDSQVLGDVQISNQVKNAYQWSADEGTAGPFLHRLLHSIFFTNKRVVQETELRDGTASTASVAVDLVKKYAEGFANPSILVVGLGEIGRTVAENLKGIDARVKILNRTKSKADDLAASLGFGSASLKDLQNEIHDTHVVISSVAAPRPLITAATLRASKTPKLLVDLSVPRSIEADVETIGGTLLYNIDQLNVKASKTLKRREAAIPAVRAIIEESIDELNDWSQEMEVSPTIRKLKNALEEIRREELSRYVANLDSKEAAILDKATKGIIQKVMKLPVLQLKAACKRGEAETLVEVLNDLFNLEKEIEPKAK